MTAAIATLDAWVRLLLWLVLVARASNALVHAADDPGVCRQVVTAIRLRAAWWNIVGWLGVIVGVSTVSGGVPVGRLVYDAAATLLVGVLVMLIAWPALRVEGRVQDRPEAPA